MKSRLNSRLKSVNIRRLAKEVKVNLVIKVVRSIISLLLTGLNILRRGEENKKILVLAKGIMINGLTLALVGEKELSKKFQRRKYRNLCFH